MKRARPEQQIQKAVFEHLRVRGASNLFAWGIRFSGGFGVRPRPQSKRPRCPRGTARRDDPLSRAGCSP